jgi:hypothetical protein
MCAVKRELAAAQEPEDLGGAGLTGSLSIATAPIRHDGQALPIRDLSEPSRQVVRLYGG